MPDRYFISKTDKLFPQYAVTSYRISKFNMYENDV